MKIWQVTRSDGVKHLYQAPDLSSAVTAARAGPVLNGDGLTSFTELGELANPPPAGGTVTVTLDASQVHKALADMSKHFGGRKLERTAAEAGYLGYVEGVTEAEALREKLKQLDRNLEALRVIHASVKGLAERRYDELNDCRAEAMARRVQRVAARDVLKRCRLALSGALPAKAIFMTDSGVAVLGVSRNECATLVSEIDRVL